MHLFPDSNVNLPKQENHKCKLELFLARLYKGKNKSELEYSRSMLFLKLYDFLLHDMFAAMTNTTTYTEIKWTEVIRNPH